MSSRLLTVLAAIALTLTACGVSAQEKNGPYDEDEIGEIVRGYILENPEIIEDALIVLQQRARVAEREAQRNMILASSDLFFGDARDPAIGNEDAPVQIVEFFDYRCPYCTLTNEWINQVIADHGDQVRVIFKEFPIRGNASEEAGRAALAVWNLAPQSYLDVHTALMSATGPLPTERIDEILVEAGLDIGEVRALMTSQTVLRHLSDTRALAVETGITGTPFFIINDTVVPGADVARLQEALDAGLDAGS